MKKLISSILALATMASVAVFPATAEDPAQGASNVSVEALYLSKKPTFDGVINADEWGEKTLTVSGADAATPANPTLSKTNVFAWYGYSLNEAGDAVEEEDLEVKAKVTAMTYDLWFRWDLEYLYIAAKVNDPDDYYLPAGRDSIWNGDALQLRVDPMGPNAYQSYKNPDYDYRTEPFDYLAANVTGYTPWAYPTKICNIGFGLIKGKPQAYDMADNGTGNMTKKQILNDPGKLGPNVNPFKDEKNYATEFAMTVNPNGDGSNTNVYEIAVPFAFLDQWELGQVAVGYAWGVSLVALLANEESGFYSYLTWGSGICGAQQNDAWLRPTCGGSNAVILSNKDAIDPSKTVEGLPVYEKKGNEDIEHVENVLDATSMSSYYFSATTENPVIDAAYTVSLDVAYMGPHTLKPEATNIGFRIGTNYAMSAGWDAEGKTFFVAESLWEDGINKDIPYATSEEFDWPIGEWHNLSVTVDGEKVTIKLDDEIMLEDEDKRNACVSTYNSTFEVLMYNLGSYVFDNYKIVTGDKVVEYNFDSDDAAWNRSDMRLQSIPNYFSAVPGVCKNAILKAHEAHEGTECTCEADAEKTYGCLFKPLADEDGKVFNTCLFCGEKTGDEIITDDVVYGDSNGDGAVDLSDVTLLLKHLASWEVEIDNKSADVNADGDVNLADATLLLKHLAGWDVVLGPVA